MPREPTSKFRTVTAEEFGVELAPAGPRDKPMWFVVIDKLGFPTAAVIGAAIIGVGYHKNMREDMAAQRISYSEQIDKLVKSQREDRDATVKALVEQTKLLQSIDDRLRERPNERKR